MHHSARPVLTALAAALTLVLGCGDGAGSTDPTSGLVVTPGALTLTEGNAPTQLFVTMDRAPDAPLTIDIGTLGKIALSKTTLTFTPEDFAVPQTIAVTPPEDIDLEAEVDTLTFSSAGADFRRVPVLVADNDVQAILAGVASQAVPEGGNALIGVRLQHQPSAPVTVTVATNGRVTRVPTTLTFTSANFATPQNVTVTSIEDNDAIRDLDTLRLTSTGIALTVVPISVVENDIQAILVTPATLTILEGDLAGGGGVVNVSLKFMPAGNVTVTLTPATGHVRTPNPLTFTPANFATPQPVNVLATFDGQVVDDVVLVTVRSSGIAPAEFEVFITDRDGP